MGWIYCTGSMTPGFPFLHSTFPSGLLGDSPATTIVCIAMEFSQSGFGSGREMTSGQQVSHVFLHYDFLHYDFLLSDANETETGI